MTANGPAVSICRNDGACEVFSDFVLAGGLLDTFSVDGQPIDQWTSEYERRTTAEALTIDYAESLLDPLACEIPFSGGEARGEFGGLCGEVPPSG